MPSLETLKAAGVAGHINLILGVNPVVPCLPRRCVSLVKEEHEGEKLQDMTELLLMYAARVQLVENTSSKPALNGGKWVLGDRHDMSSQAYQGGGRQIARYDGITEETTLGGF